MRKKLLRPTTIFILFAVAAAALAASLSPLQQGAAQSPNDSQAKQKKLKEIASERDVEVAGLSESHSEYASLEALKKDAAAIVYGRIVDSRSFFDESGHPIEYGEVITTEYAVDVYRVVKDAKRDVAPQPGRAAPAPLSTPLKIARNGGAVYVNGHRAEVKVKGYDSLQPGKQYVFFLFWSPEYRAYTLAGGISGAVMVNDDLSLKPLASAKEIQSKLGGMALEDLIKQLK